MSRPKKLFALLPGIAAALCLFSIVAALPAWIFLPQVAVERMARALMPPLYPGATPIHNETKSGTTGEVAEITSYRVPARMGKVAPWMERVMPGFRPCTGLDPHCMSNRRCNETSISKLTARLLMPPDGMNDTPCVVVVIEPYGGDASETRIHTTLFWPTK
jgi:hypothetical protein